MKVLIDADACPVTEIAVKEALKRKISVVLFCDTSHTIFYEGAETIIVSKGNDSADFALVNKTEKGDLVITQDYGLAAMCLSKSAYILNQDGKEYTDFNIGSLLTSRYENKKLRMAGKRTKGPKKRTKEQDISFYNALCAILDRITK